MTDRIARIDAARQAVREAEAELKRVIREEQMACDHPVECQVAGEYEPRVYFNNFPPFSVCRVCGYAEEGWGSGVWKLKGDYLLPRLPRHAAEKLVRGLIKRQSVLSEVRYGRAPIERLWE